MEPSCAVSIVTGPELALIRVLSLTQVDGVLAGDFQPVTVGDNSNIQDAAYVGATSEFSPPVVIGDNVSVGHGAVLKGCKIGDNVLVGINAVISENVEVRRTPEGHNRLGCNQAATA